MAKTIFAKDPEKFVSALAESLKKVPEFEVPEWSGFVKSGVSRERPPVDDDFWYVRAASILRQLYIKGVVGVGRLRTRYGSRKDRGGKADKFRKAGGKIIRVILQQAEAAGLVEKVSRLQHGRRLTQSGRDFLDSIDVPGKVMVDSSEWTVAPSMGQVEQEVPELEDEDISEEIKDEIVESKEIEEVKVEEVNDEEVENKTEEVKEDGE
jgi:small subunit ribosomal protein S19e